MTVWLGFDALKGLLRPPAWLVAAGLFVAPLSFFVYVTQEPTLSVLKAFTRTPLQTYAQRSDGGSPALAIVLYLLAPSIAIAGSIGAALLLRRLVLRVCALMTHGLGPKRRAAESPPVGHEAAPDPSGSRVEAAAQVELVAARLAEVVGDHLADQLAEPPRSATSPGARAPWRRRR